MFAEEQLKGLVQDWHKWLFWVKFFCLQKCLNYWGAGGGGNPMNFGWGCAAKVLKPWPHLRTKKAKIDTLFKAQKRKMTPPVSSLFFLLKCSCSTLLRSLCTLQYFVFVYLRNKVQTSQKIQGNVLLLNWKAHAKIQALLKEIFLKKYLAFKTRHEYQELCIVAVSLWTHCA